MMRIASRQTLVVACLVLTTTPALAQTPVTVKAEGGDVDVLADRIDQVDDLLIAVGNVEITRGASRLTADRVEINRQTGESVAQGKAVFYDGQDRLLGERIDYNLQTGTGVVYNASAFSPPYYRITGERMDRVGEGVYRIQRGVFTTCEDEPPLWSFRVGRATADLEDSMVGRDASFWVERVPLIPWVPFFAAALRRERQSGFLFPVVGNSTQKGYFAKIPFYWAISDSQDATFSLEPYSKRGVGLGGEYRYILSENHQGLVQAFGIDETEKASDPQDPQTQRGHVVIQHSWQVAPPFAVKANVNMVSDNQFFRVYGDQLAERSLQRAQTTVSATYRAPTWNLATNVLWYQDLTTDRPVALQRLPEIRFQSVRQPVPGLPGLLNETESSYTNFQRWVGSEGQRLDLHPRFLLPYTVAGYFTVTPFVGGRATWYDTKVVGSTTTLKGAIPVEITRDDPFVRLLGEWGGDVETRASRVYDVEGVAGISRLQHLIEPRVNVTYIEGVNQKNVPQWDPGGGVINPLAAPLADVGIDNRERISRLTYSLTNRVNAKTVAGDRQEAVRWELMRFSVGQTYDLPPARPGRFGDVTGELILQPNQHMRFRGDARYQVSGSGGHRLQSVNSDVSAIVGDVTATAGTRFDDQAKIDFVKGEILAKVFRNLNVRGSVNWDVQSGTVLDSRVGVDILCQCAVVRLDYIRRQGVGLGRNEDQVSFSVNLLGVGQIGSSVQTP